MCRFVRTHTGARAWLARVPITEISSREFFCPRADGLFRVEVDLGRLPRTGVRISPTFHINERCHSDDGKVLISTAWTPTTRRRLILPPR